MVYIYTVIPLTKLPRPHPQTPAYFSTNSFRIGQLVEVPLGRRSVPAVILTASRAEQSRQAIRKSPYALKKINRSLVGHPTFEESFLNLAIELADYYFVSVGLMLQRMLPPFFSRPTKPLLSILENLKQPQQANPTTAPRKTLIINSDRFNLYKKIIHDKPFLFILPEYIHIAHAKKALPDLDTIATLTKDMTQTQWRSLWQQAYEGNISGIVGTRGALFMPIRDAETLIVENENNTSHKSWDSHPKFDVRFAAGALSKTLGTHLVMGDVLPSIETYWHAKKENWEIKKIVGTMTPPSVVDMREELKNKNFSIISRELRELLQKANSQSKILLFINRRGISSGLLCRDCGHIVECPDCDVPFALHQHHAKEKREGTLLVCHHCGKKAQPPRRCPSCGGGRIKYLGGGTQRVEEEVQKIAGHLTIARLDSDTAPSLDDHKTILKNFKEGSLNVLIGTQLALKEHLLPPLSASAVVMLDTVLNLPAYRSSEQVYEIIWRLRTITKGRVLVQTYSPELPIFQHLKDNDFEPFFTDELKMREALNWPPFSQLIKLSFAHSNQQKAEQEAAILKEKLKIQFKNIQKNRRIQAPVDSFILGPAPAFIPKVRNKYLWYILIKWPRDEHGIMRNLRSRNRILDIVPPSWDIDVDPIDIT